MSTSLYEKIMSAGGFYEFNYSDPEDAALALESLGGEEKLKTAYPKVHEAFHRSVHARLRQRGVGAEQQDDEKARLIVTSYEIESEKGENVVSTKLRGFLADPMLTANEASEGKAGRPWIGANVMIRLEDQRDPTGTFYGTESYYMETVDNFELDYASEELEKTEAEHCALYAVMNALDPDNRLRTYGVAVPAKNQAISLIHSFSVDAPVSKTGNNPVIMLYGRNRQSNESYLNADYYNNDDSGEYYRNRPVDGKLKTLMPMSGKVELQPGCTFPKEGVLHKPEKGETLFRSQMMIGNVRVATQYKSLKDEEAYKILAKCFTVDTSGAYPTIKFDIKNNGSVDWLSDTEGIGNWKNSTLTYLLSGVFYLDVIDPHGVPGHVQLSISSKTAEEMKGKPYYISNSGKVYVPPIEVHWGCFAPETLIRLYGEEEEEKRVDQLKPGDKVLTADGSAATLADMAVGEDDRILRIRASAGEVRLTEGHPVMLADGSIKAAGCLRQGDMLKTPAGTSQVLEVTQEPYQGMVYNPVFEESGREGLYILANGFYCGDYNAQNRPPVREKVVLTPDQEETRNQFMMLAREMGTK